MAGWNAYLVSRRILHGVRNFSPAAIASAMILVGKSRTPRNLSPRIPNIGEIWRLGACVGPESLPWNLAMKDEQTGVNEQESIGEKPRRTLNPFQLAGSVLAAAFGVQSSKNRQRDFQEKSFLPFILAGIFFTAVFVGSIYLVVSTVLNNAR
jgi:hypothetical protein